MKIMKMWRVCLCAVDCSSIAERISILIQWHTQQMKMLQIPNPYLYNVWIWHTTVNNSPTVNKQAVRKFNDLVQWCKQMRLPCSRLILFCLLLFRFFIWCLFGWTPFQWIISLTFNMKLNREQPRDLVQLDIQKMPKYTRNTARSSTPSMPFTSFIPLVLELCRLFTRCNLYVNFEFACSSIIFHSFWKI